MTQEFIHYEQALELKELGFDEPCFAYRAEGAEVMIKYIPNCVISAPTFSQAFRWFREKYDLIGVILPYLIIGNQWYYKITNRNNSSGLPFEEGFETFEEAELACLNKLIEIVKTKNI